ncbi:MULTISPECIES: response regulator transcription factor [Elizabethkingia]|jgi:DNA-binding response OmpR family regulator|uniref:DNA-binding response regulator n=1 Tax=Elizabethkingia ursingii TaxID=1756150 RepID=A0AAJ3TQW7_9FLAO|nr:response regulator transcription factor [Elizabethkingia ursingii]MDR2228332.1 response regulator transcription factor [Flavobacteriaceae bacterium]AQX07610.1 DNA-binding response regulator [Elizabethkingia ursingii]MCL1666051.1 response regulator transcription factor [Elizabethkingia ursingii]OPB79540.1 DNA-binding response regulator [Elizabethkingia ursingii]OPB89086.1 DNA-binding response regulator [Elizabethkingia ursingii]
MKLLIIEDEIELAKSIAEYLSEENYLCEFASTYKEAIQKIENFHYDCILLDITLPDGNGLAILEGLKEQNKQDGVIIISAKNALDDKIKGLHLGADDYLTKPFHLSELMARIYSLIRRKQFSNSNVIKQNELQIDLLAKTVSVNDQTIVLTKKEFDLLIYFVGNKNRVISKSTLAEHLSGDFADMLDNHDFVYAHVKNLKKKLYDAGCDQYLKTVYGTGYKWEETSK